MYEHIREWPLDRLAFEYRNIAPLCAAPQQDELDALAAEINNRQQILDALIPAARELAQAVYANQPDERTAAAATAVVNALAIENNQR